MKVVNNSFYICSCDAGLFFNIVSVKFKTIIVIGLFLLAPLFVDAKSYDFYVDESASSGGDGSEDEPFREIEDAIEEANKESGSQEVYIEDGEYDGGFTIGKSIKLFGKDSDDVEISGTIYMNDDSSIENITVKGGRRGVSVAADADVEIEECVIRDFEKIGVDIAPGSGKLVIINSEIKNGSGKGVYVQRGNKIEFIGNEIVENDEEGFDLRSKIKGVIKNNNIYKNGESGIEIIVGEANVIISGNTIKDNKASGIAAQFYEDMDEEGDINVTGNKITGNSSFGVNCKKTQGGTTKESYWRDSIELKGNSLSGNKSGSLYKLCYFKDDVEEEDNVIEEDDTRKDDKEDENEKAKKLAEEKERQEREAREEKKRKEERIERQGEIKLSLKKYEDNLQFSQVGFNKLKKENRLKVFFFGLNQSQLDATFVYLDKQEMDLEKVEEMLSDDYLEMAEGKTLKARVEALKKGVLERRGYLQKKNKSFSLFGWIKKLF
ncbi:right-handed parallel beta-helix repeat-containing protein [bacterium]|jgi:hypothetical protein|nr:right-handed parallel beta-helix repeat-containing protein [bacterium]MBT4250785.1 right-handed parallel beta-helix repeat-containing protein [bacterium]MBT4598229.1 right-handed parallel beta-helix repeat-containing protein [bacterium]MBT6753827.1 right-handed parallel beta-helix repeat-containing protein [bacterium]MBT7037460.1 right-handed parallel beta-helix repeat-containing protein [bacterium]